MSEKRSTEAGEVIEQALELARKGDLPGATELLAPLAGDDCRDVPLLMLYATLLSRCGQREVALRHLQRAYEIEPFRLELTVILYSGYRDLARPERAEKILSSTLGHPEFTAAAAGQLASSLRDLGLHEGEVRAWERAAALDPTQPAYATNFCAALSQLSRYQEELTALDEAVRRFPDEYRLSANRVPALGRLGRTKDALAVGHEVMARWPTELGVVNNLSWYLLLDGEPAAVDEADALLTRIQGTAVPAPLKNALRGTRVLLCFRRGRFTQGLEEVRALIAEELAEWGPRFPKHIRASLRRTYGIHRTMEAMFLGAMGQTAEARSALQEAMSHHPDPRLLETAKTLLATARA